METVIFWLIVAVAVIALDIFTSSFLFMWFSIGAAAAIIASLLGGSFPVQFLAFAVVSLIAIGIGYPIVKKKYKETIKRVPLMEESYIGKVFEATEDIEETSMIKVGGVYWTAVNKGKKIEKGHKFQVTGIDGNKLDIKGLEEE